jgi:hypothetical protein
MLTNLDLRVIEVIVLHYQSDMYFLVLVLSPSNTLPIHWIELICLLSID